VVGLLVAVNSNAGAGPISPAGLSNIGSLSSTQLIQDKQKSEPLKEKVKRIWRNMTGYKFDVGCPVLIPLSHSTCTETGKNSAEAQAKCQSKNQFCEIRPMK
jgi:hypothetical protein